MFTEFQVMKSEYLHFKYFCWITAFISFLQAHRLVIVLEASAMGAVRVCGIYYMILAY